MLMIRTAQDPCDPDCDGYAATVPMFTSWPCYCTVIMCVTTVENAG